MEVTCPDGHVFEIVSNEDLVSMSITPNVRARALEKGIFPKPWAEFGNRHIWLKDDILDYRYEQNRRETERVVDPLLEQIMQFPDDRREAALTRLREKLAETSIEEDGRRKKR